MLLNIFFYAFLIYFLWIIYRNVRQARLSNQKEKSKKRQEGKIIIYKTVPKKKSLEIDAETIDFEEIKDEKKSSE